MVEDGSSTPPPPPPGVGQATDTQTLQITQNGDGSITVGAIDPSQSYNQPPPPNTPTPQYVVNNTQVDEIDISNGVVSAAIVISTNTYVNVPALKATVPTMFFPDDNLIQDSYQQAMSDFVRIQSVTTAYYTDASGYESVITQTVFTDGTVATTVVKTLLGGGNGGPC